MKKNSLKTKVWLYLSLFALIILAGIWFLQILSLDIYYEWSKKSEIKGIANKVLKAYETDDTDILDGLAFEEDICIEITENNSISYSTDSISRGCLVNNSNEINKYKLEFMLSGKDSITYKVINPKFDNKTLVYGVKINNGTYAFISTSLEPVGSTVSALKNQLIFIIIIVLVVAFLIAYTISKKISKPIENITRLSKKISEGKYDIVFDSDTDIEEINELERTLNNATEELSKTENLRRELLANVSHDLKTPLTMIKAYAEMVRDITYKDDEKREENLNVITSEVDRLNLLVSDILDLSKMQANIYELNEEDFDLVKLTQIIIDRYEIFSLTEKYKFVFECNKEKIMIHADKQKMEQVLYNLISNAVNYTGDDKVVKIKINDNKDGSCRVEVIDTGKGIKKEEIDLIWDKYYKSNKKHKRNMLGTGLGLSIVKNIFELHNYKYGVTSKKDKGSTFYFEIPKEKKCKDV